MSMPEPDSEVLRSVLKAQLGEIDGDSLRALLHSRLQHISPESRERSAASAVQEVNDTLRRHSIPPLGALPPQEDSRMQRHLAEMRESGITLLGPVLSSGQVQEVHRYLDTKGVYGSHVWTFSDRTARPKTEVRRKHSQACYILEDILGAPHLLEAISSPLLLKLVEQYLGCVPSVFQSNLMWSFQKRLAQPAVAQAFHRDWDNFRFCVLFVYLTDVNSQTGPHQYIRGSHTVQGVEKAIARYRTEGGRQPWARTEAFYRVATPDDSQVLQLFKGDLLQIEQPAGYAFLADAFGLHRGLPLIEGERLLFWTRFGLYDNGFSVDVSPAPLPRKAFEGRMPDDKTHRYIFRSLIESEYSSAQPPASLHPLADEFEAQSDRLISRFGRTRFVRKAAKLLLGKTARDKAES